MNNVQITVGNDTIDSLIDQLKKLKENNNLVIRLKGEKGAPELLIVHKGFKVTEKNKTDKK